MAKRHVLLAIWLVSVASVTSALAEEFPTRPITWVVPFAPGGITDTTSRIVAEEMSRTLGQSVVIDNRAGGGGAVGTEQVARARPDGYTMIYGAIFAPLIAALAFVSVTQAIVTALGVIIATVSAAAIQLWFRVQARRSQFRRRQTSSRLATFAEAFCSIGWAATAALAVTIPIAAVISGAMTAAILAATWKISPRRG